MVKHSDITIDYLVERFKTSDCVIIPVYYLEENIVSIGDICALYIKWVGVSDACMVGFGHPDLETFDAKEIVKLLDNSNNKVFTYRCPSIISNTTGNNVVDVDSILWFSSGVKLELQHSTYRLPEGLHSNIYVPIMNIQHYCKKIYNKLSELIDFRNDCTLSNFYKIEYSRIINRLCENGVSFDKEVLLRKYGIDITEGVQYLSSNIYTNTGRPTFKFQKIDILSIPKNNRDIINSRFPPNRGIIAEFDYDAYHPRLIAELVGYKFPDGINVHEYFAKLYFNVDHVSDEEYNESKKITFRQLYSGNIEYRNIRYYSLVAEYIDNMWNLFNASGSVSTKLGRIYRKNNDQELTKGKLFSHIIQAMETERNMDVLSKINDYLYNMKSKLILYFYDAFVFDIAISEAGEIVDGIKKLIATKEYPIKMKCGINYGEMVVG